MSNNRDAISMAVMIMAIFMLILSVSIIFLFLPQKITIHDDVKGDNVFNYKLIDRIIGQVYDFPALNDEHYIFMGYYSDANLTCETSKVQKDIYVAWEPRTYFINYENCPEELYDKLNEIPGVRKFGEETELLPIISSEYSFVGYYLDGKKVTKIPADAEDVTLEIRMYKN